MITHLMTGLFSFDLLDIFLELSFSGSEFLDGILTLIIGILHIPLLDNNILVFRMILLLKPSHDSKRNYLTKI